MVGGWVAQHKLIQVDLKYLLVVHKVRYPNVTSSPPKIAGYQGNVSHTSIP